MEVVIVPDGETIAKLSAGIVVDLLNHTPNATLGLATGSSPLPTYRALIERHRRGEVSFADARAVTLDEYVGLPGDHPQSYRNVIGSEFVDHIDLEPTNLHTPDASADDLAAACARFDRIVVDLGVDVQILGIGTDGHLAFNEPGSSLVSRTRLKTLTEQTRRDNARFFTDIDQVPRHVVTQGLGTIGDAGHLVLIATGASKADALRAAVEGPVSASCPASIIQMHRHVTVFIDDAAAGQLERADYYRHCFDHKPSWQSF